MFLDTMFFSQSDSHPDHNNSIFVKSNIKLLAEFTNCNLSQRLFELTLIFFMMLKNISFPLTVPRSTSILGKDFSLQSPEFHSCMQFEIRKDWPVDFAKL